MPARGSRAQKPSFRGNDEVVSRRSAAWRGSSSMYWHHENNVAARRNILRSVDKTVMKRGDNIALRMPGVGRRISKHDIVNKPAV